MTHLPLTPLVLTLTVLSMAFAYCAGAFASGLATAVLLIVAGVLVTLAMFVASAEAFAEGCDGGGEDAL